VKSGKMIVFSAPSGSGKTTIVKHLLNVFPDLEFSISATSRMPRGEEIDGKDYHFIKQKTFVDGIKSSLFIEFEEVYPGTYYGTLNSELKKIWDKNKIVVFDVDVIGGLNIKKQFPENTLSIFISPPDIKTLEDRLINRKTDSFSNIKTRISKAKKEIALSDKFDFKVINDDLKLAKIEIENIVREFIKNL
tara:strand:- start:14 stop:586 length:573 start_codon:yes stop_codon:yes gene_type:complete